MYINNIDTAGTCEEQGTYKCDNGRCIPNAYSCSNEINACGHVQDNCSNDEEAATSFLDSVVNILRNLLWIIAIMIAFYLLRCLYQRYHERVRSALGRLTTGQSQTVSWVCVLHSLVNGTLYVKLPMISQIQRHTNNNNLAPMGWVYGQTPYPRVVKTKKSGKFYSSYPRKCWPEFLSQSSILLIYLKV